MFSGTWCNGSTPRSHRGNEGSIPFVSIGQSCTAPFLAARSGKIAFLSSSGTAAFRSLLLRTAGYCAAFCPAPCTIAGSPKAVDSSHKYVAFLVCNATWCLEFLGNSLKLRCSFGTMGFELNWAVAEQVPMRTEMPFMNEDFAQLKLVKYYLRKSVSRLSENN